MKNQFNKVVDNIFKINLAVKNGEKVIIITDDFNSEIRKTGRLISDRGKQFTALISCIKYKNTGCHGTEPPEDVWAEAFGQNVYNRLKRLEIFKPLLSKTITKEKLKAVEDIIDSHKNEAVNVVIAIPYFSTSHTKFRDFLTGICGARYASMPLFDEMMLTGAMRVDWNEMMKTTCKIAGMVNKCEELEMKTPNGTFITLSKKGREAKSDTGILTRRGSFGNLPAGEVYFAPVEGSAAGRLVLEWAPTRRLGNPVTLHVIKGLVEKVEGNEQYADYLEKKLSKKSENKNIAEFGIGTNNRASRPGFQCSLCNKINILCGSRGNNN